MREADKERLDRLQNQLAARLGKRIGQEVLLARLVALGEEELDRLSSSQTKPSRERLNMLFALPIHTGIRTREEDIDTTLYGSAD